MNVTDPPETALAVDTSIPFWRRAISLPQSSGLPETTLGASAGIGQPVPSLLLVDDDPATIQVLAHMLAGLGHLRFALSAADALNLAHESVPDVVLVDAEMPGMNGFDFCATMKADPDLAEVPVIFVSGHGHVETEVACFAVGAADFIRKPPAAEVVVARVRTQLRLKALSDALRREALVDGLTGLANRRRFDDQLRIECDRALRSGEPLSLLMIDVDHFKRFNDRYGHPAGDACLRGVAIAIQGLVSRPADLVARYGGEEFVMLLPQTKASGATHLGDLVVKAVEALRIAHDVSPSGPVVTVSVGVATTLCSADGGCTPASPAALVNAADQAMYTAKATGRGQSCTYVPSSAIAHLSYNI
ncbi:MAG: diguanylate cyclase [Burkholderiaceae bacterium]|nr:diguanylate cyclase [Burkholderiaceae bacterium]